MPGSVRRIVSATRGGEGWLEKEFATGDAELQSLSKEMVRDFVEDAVGQHWMTHLLPLADPATVVFAAGSEAVNDRGYDVVKAAVPGDPVYTLGFDAKTHLLVRVEYTRPGTTFTSGTHAYHYDDFRPVAGVVVPWKSRTLKNGKQVRGVDGHELGVPGVDPGHDLRPPRRPEVTPIRVARAARPPVDSRTKHGRASRPCHPNPHPPGG